MFCGKTEELLRISNRYLIAEKRVLILKPKKDDRYGTGVICTHNNKATQAIEITEFDDIFPLIFNDTRKFDAIFIDEIQFINAITIDSIRNITEKLDINLYVSGLILDSFRNPFPEILNIVPYAEILELTAVCNFCGEFTAKYTYRIIKEEKEQILVGGKDLYCAICPKCLQGVTKYGK